MIGCTTAGEILDTEVSDDSLVCTALSFDHLTCRGSCVELDGTMNCHEAGRRMGRLLADKKLCHVLVYSEGLHVNGTELVHGLTEIIGDSVTVSGGLAGDGELFSETWIVWNGEATTRSVAAVGIYGDGLRVGYGSIGGWDSFGPERLITRSSGNVLYALDGISALDLYRHYLGEFADGLPASGLLFPLAIRIPETGIEVVRTILKVDASSHSMIFAGDIPEGAFARMMKANFDRLIDGAADSARHCTSMLDARDTELALLVSCVGRRMVLKQRIEEELESVRDVLGPRPAMTGFYSYGEISPTHHPSRCELHNQTMTVTTMAEVMHG